MKKSFFSVLMLMMVIGSLAAPAALAQSDAVMLVVPARYAVMQVAFDVARRYPTVLVSYQGADPNPALHVWNGFEWMPLALTDYQSGAFLQSYPSRAIFLGDDSLFPASLRSISAWCGNAVQFAELDTPALVNSIGRYLPFTPSDWRWFAGRYNLTLTNLKAAEEEAVRNESWYDETDSIQDSPPGFFKYFTRSRRSARVDREAPMRPVEVDEGEEIAPVLP
ncbi:MAG: hypothetical protein LBN38_02585 [Verrucomicrobiota bacterium]|jgi:hypothetical protein|nr:hypothetical protein [Verrucomicrobiota bacterium]